MTTSSPFSSGAVLTTIATGTLVSMEVYVTDLQTALQAFNRIEIWRSRLGEGGPYEELTGPAFASASLLSSTSGPAAVDGKTLSLRVGEQSDIDVVFAGVDPIAIATIASQITDQGLGLLSGSVEDSHLRISTAAAGAGAVLRILSSAAAPSLGFSSEEPAGLAFGRDPRILLQSSRERYNFVDTQGSATFFYKTRYRSTITNGVSEFSLPFLGRTTRQLPAANLIRGFLDLIDGQGRPIIGRSVFVGPISKYKIVGEKSVIESQDWRLTDENGHVNYTLVRGIKILVAIAGTNIVRELDVPTDSLLESFNLLDPSYGSDDGFAVQRPDVDFAVRRNW